MQIKKSLTVNVSPEKAWKVLGQEYGGVGQWASAVFASSESMNGDAPYKGATCTGRVCETSMGPFSETIREFDQDKYLVSYDASGEKMPSFVKGINNRWQLHPRADGKTDVNMLMTANLSGIMGTVMGPMMRMQMGTILKNSIEEFKYYLENDAPHPRKQKAMQKLQNQTA